MNAARPIFSAFFAVCGTAQAPAQSLEFGGSVQVNSMYENDETFVHTENTLQLSLVTAYNGVAFELEAESLNDAEPDRAEISWTLAYGGVLAEGLEWSAAYSRTYLDASGWDGHELAFGLASELSDAAAVSLEAIRDLGTDTTDVEIGFGFEPMDQLAFGVLLGRSGEDRSMYGEFGAAYAINDEIAFELLYETAVDEPGLLTLSAIWEFSLTD